MAQLGPVVVRKTIAAAQRDVWHMLVDAEQRHGWWPDTAIDAVLGGEISEVWQESDSTHLVSRNALGTIDVLIPERTLGFRWREQGDQHTTTVVIMLRPADEDFSHTTITVIESGFAALPNAEALVQSSHEGWQTLFTELDHTLTDLDEEDDLEYSDAAAEETAEVEEVDVEEIVDEEESAEEVVSEEEPTEDDLTEDVVDEEPAAEEEPEVIEVFEGELIDDDYSSSNSDDDDGDSGEGPIVRLSGQFTDDDIIEVDHVSEWDLILRGEDSDQN